MLLLLKTDHFYMWIIFVYSDEKKSMCHFSFLYILLAKKGNWQSDLLKHVQIYINTCIYSVYDQRLSLYSIFNPFILSTYALTEMTVCLVSLSCWKMKMLLISRWCCVVDLYLMPLRSQFITFDKISNTPGWNAAPNHDGASTVFYK